MSLVEPHCVWAGFNEFCLLSWFLFVHRRCEKLHPGGKCGAGLNLNGLVIACYMCGSLRTFMTFSCEISGMVASSPYFMFIFQITMNVEIKKTTKNMCDNFQIPLLQ